MALSSNFAQRVKADADIVRIIGEHLRLRKSRSWKGRSKKEVRKRQPRYNIFGGGGTMQDYEFTVVIEKDEDGRFVAICPALQGCYTEGETEEEARQLIEDAIRLHVESRIARNEPIYQEVGSHRVRVAV